VGRRAVRLSPSCGHLHFQIRSLVDLLYRQRNGELAWEIPLIISNHEDARRHAEFHGVPCDVIPVSKATKAGAEAAQQKLVNECQIDLIVLARYMPILSSGFPAHHKYPSFLPARFRRRQTAPASLRPLLKNLGRHGSLRDRSS
jgi:folate-dependent phosphoribosylglycinamide formyltransferase PurN